MNKFNAMMNEDDDAAEQPIVISDMSHVASAAELQIVERGLTNYIGFDINQLWSLNVTADDAIIFGGAPRDCIAQLPIHDIDILALPRAARTLATILSVRGFNQLSLISIDCCNLYANHIIHEPWTFVRNKIIVQIIRPAKIDTANPVEMQRQLKDRAAAVDITACGLAYTPGMLRETVVGALGHCRQKVFEVIKSAAFYRPDRIDSRRTKLASRGWKELDTQRSSNSSNSSTSRFLDIINSLEAISQFDPAMTTRQNDGFDDATTSRSDENDHNEFNGFFDDIRRARDSRSRPTRFF